MRGSLTPLRSFYAKNRVFSLLKNANFCDLSKHIDQKYPNLGYTSCWKFFWVFFKQFSRPEFFCFNIYPLTAELSPKRHFFWPNVRLIVQIRDDLNILSEILCDKRLSTKILKTIVRGRGFNKSCWLTKSHGFQTFSRGPCCFGTVLTSYAFFCTGIRVFTAT